MHARLLVRALVAVRENTKTLLATKLEKSTSSVPVTSKEFYRRPLPRHCFAFSSPEGRAIFREALLAGHMEAYFGLAAQLCTQAEPAYCGLATLVMILNAFEMDPGRVWKGPWRWYHETMLTCCVDSNILTEGIVLDKFAEMARCNGLNVEMHRVHKTSRIEDFRDLVFRMTSSDHAGYLVSCYDRSAVGQTGTGHFAAIGGYHPQRELVFVFDTARFKYPPHWVPLARLWEGMGRVDPATQQPRGYLILTRATAVQLKPEINDCPQMVNTAQFPFGVSNLLLFDISHSTWQAYLSPVAISDKRSVGSRLRQVADCWTQWLETPISPDYPLNDTLIKEAARFLLDTCVEHKPGSFFLTIKLPTVPNTPDERNEHQLLRDLLCSFVGRAVAQVVSEIPSDRFDALTGDSGTFRLAVGPGFGTKSSSVSTFTTHCPFAELKDAGLRLTIFLTCFLIFSPNCCTGPSSKSSALGTLTRGEAILHLTNQMELSDLTRTEMSILQTLFVFLSKSALALNDDSVMNCRLWTRHHV